MMTTLKAPKLTAAQRKDLEKHKLNLEQSIQGVEDWNQKAVELRKKEQSLEKKAAALHRRAAAFEIDAENELAATLKQIERVHDAIRELNSLGGELLIFEVTDNAQELISRVCQKSYEELLDQIGSALAPFYPNFHEARYVGRGAPSVNDLVNRLLAHRIAQFDSFERQFDAAKETLAKVNALLSGSEIWSYNGGGSRVAADPN